MNEKDDYKNLDYGSQDEEYKYCWDLYGNKVYLEIRGFYKRSPDWGNATDIWLRSEKGLPIESKEFVYHDLFNEDNGLWQYDSFFGQHALQIENLRRLFFVAQKEKIVKEISDLVDILDFLESSGIVKEYDKDYTRRDMIHRLRSKERKDYPLFNRVELMDVIYPREDEELEKERKEREEHNRRLWEKRESQGSINVELIQALLRPSILSTIFDKSKWTQEERETHEARQAWYGFNL